MTKCVYPNCNSSKFSAIDLSDIKVLVCEHGHANAANASGHFIKMLESAMERVESNFLLHIKFNKDEIAKLQKEVEKLKEKIKELSH